MADNVRWLKSGIQAAMQVMNQNKNIHDHMPKEATPETVDAAAKEVGTAMTIVDKNKIITNHYNNLGLEGNQKTNQSLAAFERAVMKSGEIKMKSFKDIRSQIKEEYYSGFQPYAAGDKTNVWRRCRRIWVICEWW